MYTFWLMLHNKYKSWNLFLQVDLFSQMSELYNSAFVVQPLTYMPIKNVKAPRLLGVYPQRRDGLKQNVGVY